MAWLETTLLYGVLGLVVAAAMHLRGHPGQLLWHLLFWPFFA